MWRGVIGQWIPYSYSPQLANRWLHRPTISLVIRSKDFADSWIKNTGQKYLTGTKDTVGRPKVTQTSIKLVQHWKDICFKASFQCSFRLLSQATHTHAHSYIPSYLPPSCTPSLLFLPFLLWAWGEQSDFEVALLQEERESLPLISCPYPSSSSRSCSHHQLFGSKGGGGARRQAGGQAGRDAIDGSHPTSACCRYPPPSAGRQCSGRTTV